LASTSTTPTSALTAPSAEPLASRPGLAVATLAYREWVRFIRQRNRVFGAIGQPLLFWILFGAGLGPSFRMSAAGGAGDVSYREYFFPGTLVLILLFTAIFSTISIIEDRCEGFLQSVLVAPVSRWAMVLGKLAGGTAIALAQGLLFLVLWLTLGMRISLVALSAIVVFSALLSFALVALGFVIAWRMDSTQGFHAVMSVFLMPMWLLSGAFFPAESGPLAWILRANPLSYGVAGLRRLLYWGSTSAELPAGLPDLSTCWIVTLLFAAVMFGLCLRSSGRRTTGDLL